MSLLSKNILSSHGEINFLNMQVLRLLSKLLVKIKQSDVFVVHNDTQKTSF